MLIVIVIISILLALTFGISGDRVQMLKEKYIQEQFVYNYNTLFSRNFLTNYHDEKLYENLHINMGKGDWWFSYYYKSFDRVDSADLSEKANIQWGNYSIKNLYFTWWSQVDLSFVDIIFEPYKFGCILSWNDKTWEILELDFSVADTETLYCYQINSDLCRLEKVNCPDKEE